MSNHAKERGSNLTQEAINKAEEVADRLRGLGHDVEMFPHLSEVLDAIANESLIDGFARTAIDIAQKIEDHSFRFVAQDHPEASELISNFLGEYYQRMKELPSPTDKSITTRKNKADEYAVKTGELVKRVQQEEKVTSFRKTIKALNERGIPTPNPKDGTIWQISTLQSLYSRLGALAKKEGFER